MDPLTFAHFQALLADARTDAALDQLRAELQDYVAANPGDPVAGEIGEQISLARRALAALRHRGR